MYAMALLIQNLGLFRGILPEGMIFHVSIVLSAFIVLGYIFLGGLTSAIYNEVLQFFLIVAGFAWYERSRPPSQIVALVAALAALAIATVKLR